MAVWINDDYEHFMVRNTLEDMTQAGLERQVDLYHKAGVGAVFFCVNAQSTYYESKVWDSAWKDVVRKEDGLYYHFDTVITNKPLPTLTNTLHAKALCENTGNRAYQIRIDRCRKHNMLGGLSIRMNDQHLTDYVNSPMHSDFWVDNPQYRLSCGGLDYGEEPVRAEMKKLISEVFEMFDMDAVELDWMRSPPFFRSGQEEENSKYLDELVRFAWEQKCHAQKRYGHEIKLTVRVPSRPEEALFLGLDVIRWAKEGWIDAVIACAFILCTDSNTPQWIWRTLLPERVMFAPGMDVLTMSHSDAAGIEGDEYTLEILSGYAAAFYYRGAENLYLFNHFFSAAPAKDDTLYLQKMASVHSREEAEKSARRHVATLCCNLVPGVAFHSDLPLRGSSSEFRKVRIEVGGTLKGRKLYCLFAFTGPESLLAEDFEFQVNEVPCRVVEDPYNYALPAGARHDLEPKMPFQRFICAVPEEAVSEGNMVLSFRTCREMDVILHWCEVDVEKASL